MNQIKRLFKHQFWVTNINQKVDIGLSDLRVTIRAGKSYNLLDNRHYSFTLEQLKKSAKSGSIKAKSKWIKVRDVPPRQPVKPGLYESSDRGRLSLARNNIKGEESFFEELDFMRKDEFEQSIEKFAEEEADIAFNDDVPALAVDKKFKK